ncbi:hypothetical protein KHA80_12425 [Anaerobacillus sp. HL2]|nr:hypothetical protein KHA80_12425 [Anaerobacillus sp. HL2]
MDGMVTTIGSPLIKDIDSSPTEESQTTKEVTSELKILNDKGDFDDKGKGKIRNHPFLKEKYRRLNQTTVKSDFAIEARWRSE